MATAQDVAAYILAKKHRMSTWQLQKLLYYAQAWHLAWEDDRLFPERFQAWANGPVIREIYDHHKGEFSVDSWQWGNASALDAVQRHTVDGILGSYGHLTGRQLSQLTHEERPWQEARAGLPPTAPSSNYISEDTMRDFYSALDLDEDAIPVTQVDWQNR